MKNYAGFRRRLVAALIDGLIVSVVPGMVIKGISGNDGNED